MGMGWMGCRVGKGGEEDGVRRVYLIKVTEYNAPHISLMQGTALFHHPL